MRKYFLYVTDLIVVLFAPFLALAIRENLSPSAEHIVDITPYALTGVVISAICFLVAGTHKTVWRYVSIHDFMRVLTAVTISMAAILFFTFTFSRLEGVPRSVPFIQWHLTVTGMMMVRLLVRMMHKWYRSRDDITGDNREHVLILGVNPITEFYMRYINDFARGKIEIEGIIDEDPTLNNRSLHSKRVIGTPVQIPQILAILNVRGISIDRLVITEPFDSLPAETRELILKWERLNYFTIEKFSDRLGLDSSVAATAPSLNDVIGRMKQEHFTVRIQELHDRMRSYGPWKRAIDIIGSLVLIVILSPVIAATAIVVAVNLGSPVLFWQKRTGYRERPFRIHKFRTMIDPHDTYGQAIPADQRETRISTFLRRTRMDELPQLYHILVGEMSFVGPRPLLVEDLPAQYPELIRERMEIRPGLTGWAQVNGGKDVSREDKIMMDIYYKRKSSLYLDMIIILKTIRMVIRGEKINHVSIARAWDSLGFERLTFNNRSTTPNIAEMPLKRVVGENE